ncbi:MULTISPECIES: IS630 family transposase [unclassified Spirosoma]|uniref:IS630 family transposase n=1 Tax=unclassified Spirosoma TaxID=2621999 RepID=UPI000961BEEA|nr:MULTISPECIES: IS630 family transposase [unclassified Spirosoma]MBN8823761.1 IS630 family transposase [Spirosoma sp.]OJW76694.1 MAG: hypothetical protein BGO59_20860 [Spirosoma sp. 48-14]
MKKYHITLTDAERQQLQAIIAKRNAKSQAVKRAYVLLAADENQDNWKTDEQIKATYQVSIRSIERLRERFVEDGFEFALNGKKREKYKEVVFDGTVEAHLIALRCSDPPAGYAHWTVRLLAEKMIELNYVETIGRETVRKMLKKNELKPCRVKSWVIPEASAKFVCQMEEVLEVYQRPYDPTHPVICLDEARRQLLSETRSGFRDPKGVQHYNYEYKREGVAEVFMVAQPLAGRREVVVTDSHNSLEWAKVVGLSPRNGRLVPTASRWCRTQLIGSPQGRSLRSIRCPAGAGHSAKD